jgi:hypothetical protein
LTLWKHEFTGPAGRMTYVRRSPGNWYNGNGYKFFLKDLAWGLAHLGGVVRVSVAVRDWNASPRVRMAECYPAPKLLMRVTHLDPGTGAFRLEQVAPNHVARSVVDSHAHSQAT